MNSFSVYTNTTSTVNQSKLRWYITTEDFYWRNKRVKFYRNGSCIEDVAAAVQATGQITLILLDFTGTYSWGRAETGYLSRQRKFKALQIRQKRVTLKKSCETAKYLSNILTQGVRR